MKKLHFSATINAAKEKVWQTMLDDATYRQWTEPFGAGGFYKGDWRKGSKILFIGVDPTTGQEAGMVSRIADNRQYEFVSIEHLGIVANGVEDTTSDEAKKWASAVENYTFTEKGGATEVKVDVDVAEDHEKMFADSWPVALKKLKDLAEA